MRDDLILEDTTLRDGEQTPGVAFSAADKTRILDALISIGVRWIEIGIPAMGGEELDFIRSVVDRQDEAHLVVWHRGVREDVERTLDMGFRHVHIGLPTSKIHLDASVKKDRTWLVKTARDLVGLAKDRGAFVSVSAEDLARTEVGFLQEYAGIVHEAGADRLRLSDTIGTMPPEDYGARMALVAAAADIDLQSHAHNDFGLGTANTLAAIRAGARYFHVAVNGIGERAGMADLAQVVMALKKIYGVDLGIDTTRLVELSRLLDELTGHRSAPWHPVVGTNVFAHESGIHVNGMMRDTSSFEPYAPEEVGGQRRYVLGKHSGRALVRAVLLEHGVDVDDETANVCLAEIRQRAIRNGGEVAPAELVEIHRSLVGAR